jgi:D-glycero-alpha-D-manno-heptose-7-phosphate kinase
VSVVFARAPLRISLGGGGTDLPSYYREHGGFVVSAAIDKYVYMLVNTAFQSRYRLKHTEWEEVEEPAAIRHPFLREAITAYWNGRPLELASVADAPEGTGLGSSGAYTVCVLKAIHTARGLELGPRELAEHACEIEIERLRRTVGKQDQYVSAHGGIRAYEFEPDGSVEARALELGNEARAALRERFLLFYTGGKRSASDLLSHQVDRTLAGDESVVSNLHRAKEVARETARALEAGDLQRCGELMNVHWETKRARSPAIATDRIEELREVALGSGGSGAMLMGAGGGGFLLVFTASPEDTRAAMDAAGAPELRFDLDAEGCVAWAHG